MRKWVVWICVAILLLAGAGEMSVSQKLVKGPFTIVVLNDDDVALGRIVTATRLNDTKRLSKVGTLDFTMPASDPQAALITTGVKFDVYDKIDGYLGRYYYVDKSISDNNGNATLSVSARDQLYELTLTTIWYNRAYNNEPVSDVIDDLVAVAGWTADVDAGLGNVIVQYQGNSILNAIDVLRDRQQVNFRLNDTDELGYGDFGDDSGVRLISARGQNTVYIEEHPEVAIVTSIRQSTDTEHIVRRVIPVGAGVGTSQLTIEEATADEYVIQNQLNEDGFTRTYYIEDATAPMSRDRILSIPQINPLSGSETDRVRAAQSLYDSAQAWIKKNNVERVTYDVGIHALRQEILPGQLVRLQYTGQDPDRPDDSTWIQVDSSFYVMDITRNRDATGERNASMVLSSKTERRTSDVDVIESVVTDVQTLKNDVRTNVYNRTAWTIDRDIALDDPNIYTAFGWWRYRPYEVYVHKAYVTLVASFFLRVASNVIIDDHAAGVTGLGGAYIGNTGNNTAAGDPHQHPQTNPDHTHTTPALTHTVTYDNDIPSIAPAYVGIIIDGIDRTAALGGPWQNNSVLHELDITDYVSIDAGNHYVKLYVDDTSLVDQCHVYATFDMFITINAQAIE